VDAQYATLSLLLWNANKRSFTISAAGTLPPLILRSGKILNIQVTGVPIGLLEDRAYDEVEFAAQPGDLVVLYSDGVEDQLAEDGDYGRDRLEEVLLRNSAEKPQQVIAKVFEDMDRFRGATSLTDDQSLVAMRVL
jgi:sigma-B regulation protein RsbU (phosphoserine phosphatase)